MRGNVKQVSFSLLPFFRILISILYPSERKDEREKKGQICRRRRRKINVSNLEKPLKLVMGT